MHISRRRVVATAALIAGATVVDALHRPANSIDVRAFGALGDGITDDTGAIQLAVDAAERGTPVWIGNGVYSCRGIVVSTPGLTMTGPGTLRQRSITSHLIEVRAADVTISSLRFEGIALSATEAAFAVYTSSDYPARGLQLIDLTVSSSAPERGFNNGFKLDVGADRSRVANCLIERLHGSENGFGYAILCGAVSHCLLENNTGLGGAGRGRHFIYLSSGASFTRAINNSVRDFERDGITVYAKDYQPACVGNEISNNILLRCANSVVNGSISIAQNVSGSIISGNLIRSSGGCGILADGTGSRLLRNNDIIGNRILDSQFIGIDLKAFRGGRVLRNEVFESSHAAPGTYSNIRLSSDGETATTDVLLEGNTSGGRRFARSAFQTNATEPLPRGIVLRHNLMQDGVLARYEFPGGRPAIEGEGLLPLTRN